MTASYHPQANGLVERMNGTLCDAIRAFSVTSGVLWDETVPAILFAYRSTRHAALGTSPARMTFGIDLRTPFDAELDLALLDYQGDTTDPAFLHEHLKALQAAREWARNVMSKYQQDYTDRYDSLHETTTFLPGYLV